MIVAAAVVVAYSRVQVARRKEALHIVSEYSLVAAVATTVAGKETAEVVRKEVVVVDPIVAHIEMEVGQAARKAAEVVHMVVAAQDLAAGLDHMT